MAAEREIKIRLRAIAAQETKKAVDDVAARVKAFETATKQSATTTAAAARVSTDHAKTLQQTAQRYGAMSQAMGTAGTIVGQLNPKFSALAGVIGSAGGAATGLSGAFGPLGLAIGAVTSVAGIFIKVISDAQTEMDNLARAGVDVATKSFEDFNAELAKSIELQARERRFRMGVASAQEAGAQAGVVGQDIGRLSLERGRILRQLRGRDPLTGAPVEGGQDINATALQDRLVQLDRQIADRRAELNDLVAQANEAQASENEALAEQNDIELMEDAARERARRRQSARGNAPPTPALSDPYAVASGNLQGGGGAEVFDLDAYREQLRIQQEQEAAQIRQNQARAELNDILRNGHRLTLEELDAQEEMAARLERNAALMQMGLDVATTASHALVDSFALAIESGENLGKSLEQGLQVFLKSFAIEEGKKALSAMFEAIGLSILNPPAAGTKWAEAAGHAGLALSGGVGVAIAGSAGGGGAPQSGLTAGGPQTDRMVGASPSRRGDGGNVTNVINVSTFAAGTVADVGREVRGALRAAERQDGNRF